MMKKFLRILVFLLIAGVTLTALVLALYSLHGRRELDKTKRELLAQGERLSYAEFLPAPIPDTENFYADPFWLEIAERERSKEQGKAVEGAIEFDRLRAVPDESRAGELSERFPEFMPLSGKRPLSAVEEKLRKGSPAERRRAGEFMIELLRPAEPTLEKIKGLSQRSAAVEAFSGKPGDVPISPYTSAWMAIMRTLSNRAEAEAWTGRTEQAVQSVELIVRLVHLMDHRLMIGYLVKQSMVRQLCDAVRNVLESHALDEAQLVRLQRGLESIDVLQAGGEALRGERGFSNSIFEAMQSGDPETLKRYRPSESNPFLAGMNWLDLTVLLPADQARSMQKMQQAIDLVASARQHGLNVRDPFLSSLAVKFEDMPLLRRILFKYSELSTPVLFGVIMRLTETQIQLDQAILACALERYRLKHGEYPADLQALVSEQVEQIPSDLATARAMSYRRESEGYLLWSVGWNGVDDNALVERGGGDWVWGKSWGEL